MNLNQDKAEKRKQQITEIMNKAQELCDLILNSDDYIRYQKELKELKESGEIYRRMNEYRRKNLGVQILEDSDNAQEKIQELYTEYNDVLNEPLVSQFLITEQALCKTMRKVQNRVFDSVDLDISYMD